MCCIKIETFIVYFLGGVHWQWIKNNKQNLALTEVFYVRVCSIKMYRLRLNYEILQTKGNFPLGEREDSHELNQMEALKLPTGPNLSLFFCLRFGFMLSSCTGGGWFSLWTGSRQGQRKILPSKTRGLVQNWRIWRVKRLGQDGDL